MQGPHHKLRKVTEEHVTDVQKVLSTCFSLFLYLSTSLFLQFLVFELWREDGGFIFIFSPFLLIETVMGKTRCPEFQWLFRRVVLAAFVYSLTSPLVRCGY